MPHMAGMNITVCLPSRAADRVDDAVAEAMAPFEIDHTRGEESDIWDAWRVTGGEDRGRGFTTLPGHERDPRLIHELQSRWLSDPPAPSAFGRCAGGPRELLDFSASPEEAAELAAAAWQRWRELTKELPAARSWMVHHDRQVAEFRTYSMEQASADYGAQPLVRAFDDYLDTLPRQRFPSWFLGFGDPVLEVGGTDLPEFVQRQVHLSTHLRNVLTLGGWWHEDGGPGVHGTCDSIARCPHAPEFPTGQEHIDHYLETLPGDTLLVNVRCHV